LARGDDALDGACAAGAMLLPRERRTALLLVAAVAVHLALSLGWAGVMAVALPRRAEPAWESSPGLGIAALDLSVIGRRIPAIRALPQGRQGADHVAYGLGVGLVLRKRRSGGVRREWRQIRRTESASRRLSGRSARHGHSALPAVP
jgi:hypothetical protein